MITGRIDRCNSIEATITGRVNAAMQRNHCQEMLMEEKLRQQCYHAVASESAVCTTVPFEQYACPPHRRSNENHDAKCQKRQPRCQSAPRLRVSCAVSEL